LAPSQLGAGEVSAARVDLRDDAAIGITLDGHDTQLPPQLLGKAPVGGAGVAIGALPTSPATVQFWGIDS
jgi:hypothetical protein